MSRRRSATTTTLSFAALGLALGACGASSHTLGGPGAGASAAALFTATGGATAVDVAMSASGAFVVGNFRGTLDGPAKGAAKEGGFLARTLGPDAWLRTLDGHRAVAVAASQQRVVVAAIATDAGGGSETWVTAYDPDKGEPAWSRQLAATGYVHARDVATVAQDTYVVGEFSGALEVGDITLRADGLYDGFVVALDASGGIRWARRFGGLGAAYAAAVSVRGTQVVVAGGFTQIASAGGVSLESRDDSYDIIVISLDEKGVVGWARALGGPATDSAHSLAIGEDEIAVLGSFEVGLAFKGVPTMSKGGSDILVATYSLRGEPRKMITVGSDGTDLANGAAFSPDGLLFVGALGRRGPAGVSGAFLGRVTDKVRIRELRGKLSPAGFETHGGGAALAATLRGRLEIAGQSLAAPQTGAALVMRPSLGQP